MASTGIGTRSARSPTTSRSSGWSRLPTKTPISIRGPTSVTSDAATAAVTTRAGVVRRAAASRPSSAAVPAGITGSGNDRKTPGPASAAPRSPSCSRGWSAGSRSCQYAGGSSTASRHSHAA
ncbi:hypothetical protein BJF78_02290 [Pseudonocardia sp. CNS-139]|nr:hypothetical protein BJF78_02290 [Pseudonocardia sp. CNS-139]